MIAPLLPTPAMVAKADFQKTRLLGTSCRQFLINFHLRRKNPVQQFVLGATYTTVQRTVQTVFTELEEAAESAKLNPPGGQAHLLYNKFKSIIK
jgi:hypothetical protein